MESMSKCIYYEMSKQTLFNRLQHFSVKSSSKIIIVFICYTLMTAMPKYFPTMNMTSVVPVAFTLIFLCCTI